MQPSESLVCLVDMGLYGRALAIGSRLAGDVLQWYDGAELHLVRGRLAERRRGFDFERASDGQVFRFVPLEPEAFEKRFRTRFPEAPHDLDARALGRWLLERHGLWPPPAPPADPD